MSKPGNGQLVHLQDRHLFLGKVVNIGNAASSSSNDTTANTAYIKEVDKWGLQATCDVNNNNNEFTAITFTTLPPHSLLGPLVPKLLDWQKDWELTVNGSIVRCHISNTSWWLSTGASLHHMPYLRDLTDVREIAPIHC
jgi:hypothetical protein